MSAPRRPGFPLSALSAPSLPSQSSHPLYRPPQCQALSNSERYAGWSRNRVQQLNNANDGFSYTINYYQNSYIIKKGKKQTKKAYAYEIHVTKSWNNEEIVYEDVFDSYSMDLNTFICA